jgi:hypothetical protein
VARSPVSRRRGCGQIGDSGGVLDLPEAGEQVDGVQLVTVMSNVWSASSMTSRFGVEVRLEGKEASGVAGVLDLLCNRTITMNQKVRHRERRDMEQKRGRRVLHCTGIRRRFACSSVDSGERFCRPGGVIS